MTFYAPPMYAPPIEGSPCKVTELHNAHASMKVAFLCFSINADYGYVYTNHTCFF